MLLCLKKKKKAPNLSLFWVTLTVQVVAMQDTLIYASNCSIKRLQKQLNGTTRQSEELHM